MKAAAHGAAQEPLDAHVGEAQDAVGRWPKHSYRAPIPLNSIYSARRLKERSWEPGSSPPSWQASRRARTVP